MNRIRREIEAVALGPLEKTDEGVRRRYRFAEDFTGFSGHFPGYPLLPAVLQVLMSQMVAEEALGTPLTFAALQRAKFSEQLRPNVVIEVRVRCDEKDGKERCRCELVTGGKKAAGFTLLCDKS